MIERRIKELAIALESLSRINDHGAAIHFQRVSHMLRDTLHEAKELHTPIKPTPAPATLDDEIPF